MLDNDDEGRKAYQHLNKNIAKDMCKNLDIELYTYPRADGLKWDLKSVKQSWEVEDFLPVELAFDGINKLLRKAKYASITKELRKKRNELANIDKSILEYAEQMSGLRNSSKAPFPLQGSGQKMSLCLHVIQLLDTENIDIPVVQEEFIDMICKS